MPESLMVDAQSSSSSNTAASPSSSNAAAQSAAPPIAGHGARTLPAVTVDTYNEELRDGQGFVGDRASRRAFNAIFDDWRERMREAGFDPFDEYGTREISKSKLDQVLKDGDPMAAGLVHSAVEEFAIELAAVVSRFMSVDSWRGTERIVIGGGMSATRVGALAMGRANVLLADAGIDLELTTIRHHPDKAGLIGAVYLAPSWVLAGHDAILAVDIGGTNIRAGVVKLNLKKKHELDKSEVWKSSIWRHANDQPMREEALSRLGDMLVELAGKAQKEGLKLAPFLGVGCPGAIDAQGTIAKGGQNLPGNWEGDQFNLPSRLQALLPPIEEHEIAVVMHNDAVVQGLSEVPQMRDVTHWGVLTIGTGLGNARFTNRTKGE